METPTKYSGRSINLALSWQILLGTVGLLIVVILGLLFVLSRGLQWTGSAVLQQHRDIQQLSEKFQNADHAMAQLTAEVNTFSQNWQTDKKSLAWREAYQWVQMGYQQMTVLQDPKRAMIFFQFADARLARENQPQWQSLREAIAIDVAALQKRVQFDRSGVMAKWHTLKQQLLQLPLRHSQPPTAFSTSAVMSAKMPLFRASWREGLQQSLETLQKLIVVRRYDKPVSPLLPVQETQYLRQHLALLCDQAVFAVAQADPIFYKQSTSDLDELVTMYFDPQMPSVSAALTQFNQLRKLVVDFDSSDVSHALSVFRADGEGAQVDVR